MADVNSSVAHILTPMERLGILDRPPSGSLDANVTSAEHNALARIIAVNATVLLKNQGNLLPLGGEARAARQATAAGMFTSGVARPLTIAVVGQAAHYAPIVGGGGSGQVDPPYVITALDGIRQRAAQLAIGANVTYDDGSDVARAAALAATSEVTVLVVGCTSSEGADRPSLSLPSGQDELVEAVAAAAPGKVVVVLAVPGAILTPWADKVDAILLTWMAGQEAGHALADVLFGEMDPGGRLPLSLPNKENEVEFSTEQYPGVREAGVLITNYTEGLLVGYRWYEHAGIAPAFPFGHGLSYTTFKFSDLQLAAASPALPGDQVGMAREASFVLTNTGVRDGIAVPQLYIAFPPTSGEPPKVLRHFAKVNLRAGEQTRLRFTLQPHDFQVWDEAQHGWASPTGQYTVLVGASSADIRLQAPLTMSS